MASCRPGEVTVDADCTAAIGQTCAVADFVVGPEVNVGPSVVVTGDPGEHSEEVIEETSVVGVMATGEEKVVAVDEAVVSSVYLMLLMRISKFRSRLS